MPVCMYVCMYVCIYIYACNLSNVCNVCMYMYVCYLKKYMLQQAGYIFFN